MKWFSVFLFLFFLQAAFAQQKVEQIMKDATCNCMGSIVAADGKDKFNNCFVEAVGKNAGILAAEAEKRYGKATKETGRKLGMSLMEKLCVDMVYTCDAYYKGLDEARYLRIKNANKDSILDKIEQINRVDSSKREADFFTNRGLLFFTLQKVDEAIADFDRAIEKDSSASFQSMYFKAWSLEIQKKYDEAEKLYLYVAAATKNKKIEVLAAIAKRKKIESSR